MANPGSCNSGFMPWPSAGAGESLMNGLEVKITKAKKAEAIMPCTARTRAFNACGMLVPKAAIKPAKITKMKTHNSIEPS